MKLTKKILKNMLRAIKMTRPDEIGCDECFDQLHEFAELELAGKSPEEAMPRVEEHLERCGNCRQEYEALLEAMRALKTPG
ncbi:MAG: anti-sigma factor family protein [Balneolaceae bacterium]